MDKGQDFLSLDDLQEYPTIANQKPADKLSDRYGFVPTIKVCEALYDQGWQARVVKEQGCKNDDLMGTQKHMIRFAKPTDQYTSWERVFNRAGMQLEIIFFGSHDGSTRFKLFLGFLRFVCFNETVTGDMLEEFCFVHRNKAQIGAAQAIQAVTDATPRLAQQVNKLYRTELTDSEMYAFGARALELKHGDGWLQDHRINVSTFVESHRTADAHQNVFNVYNRCQEMLLQGGYKYAAPFKKEVSRIDAQYLPGVTKTAKPVKNLNVELKLNQGLWQQALEFGEYLAA